MHGQQDHDHSHITHSKKCDEAGCQYVAQTHAHDDETVASLLSYDLAEHNKKEHNIETNPEEIKDDVKAKMKTHE